MGVMNSATAATNSAASVPTRAMLVEKTQWGFSPSLLAKRKKVVSMPKVSTTSMRAVYAYRFVTTP